MKNTKFWQVFVETKLKFCKVTVITWLEKKSGDHWQPEKNWHHEEDPLLHIQKAKVVPVLKLVLHPLQDRLLVWHDATSYIWIAL